MQLFENHSMHFALLAIAQSFFLQSMQTSYFSETTSINTACLQLSVTLESHFQKIFLVPKSTYSNQTIHVKNLYCLTNSLIWLKIESVIVLSVN